jgi:hypothetical protein
MKTSFLKPFVCAVFACAALAACSPKFNWRDYNSQEAPFRAMFPDKPASHTRTVDLDGMKVEMTMTAADVDGTMFAIGTAEAPDADKAEAALAAMKTALVKNIGATITSPRQAPRGRAARPSTSKRPAPGTARRCAWSAISSRATSASTRSSSWAGTRT